MRSPGPPQLIRPSRHQLTLMLALLAIVIAAMIRWWPRSEPPRTLPMPGAEPSEPLK